jgi:hypothetical protein
MAKEGESVQPRRKAAAKAAEEWQVARKVEGLRAEGEKVISRRAEGAQKLQAYVKDQRASSIVGDWADADGMLCRLKADGTVLVCVEMNQCVGCTRQFFTKSFLGDGAAVLARSSGEERAPPRYRAGVASMAWRTTRQFSTNAP